MIYNYPSPMPWIKTGVKILIPILILLNMLLIVIVKPEDYGSTTEYFLVLTFLILFPLPFIWFLFSVSDIRIGENGVWVEFLFTDLFVPWEDVMSVRFIGAGPRFTGIWFVKTKVHRLTWFHVTYGLFYTRSFSRGFVIHPLIKGEKELIKQLQQSANIRS